MRVLILSSSMGAGHDGAGNELIARLEAQGHEAEMHDYLDALPLHIGHLIRFNYRLQLRYAPWSYENSYHMMPRIYGLLVFLNGFLARRRLNRWMKAFSPDVVVSNNPLATLAIGRLREKSWLKVPAITFITDFGVHPLWVHTGIDAHLAVHPAAAADASRRSGGGRASAPGPLVGACFQGRLPDRRTARAALGLDPGQRAVLVVAGSWGVGEVQDTARLLLDSGRYLPVTVCGHDEKLRAHLADQSLGIVLGWTDEMPTLMAACDALVENAGGLTSMEAFAAGLPVVTFNPIPGHGRENATAMAAAGVTRWPDTVEELLAVLDEVTVPGTARDEQVATARAIFDGDAAVEILAVAEAAAGLAPAPSAPIPIGVRRRRVVRRLAGAAAAMAAVYGTMTAGVAVAASYGLTVPSDAHPQRQITLAGVRRPVTYLGVRLSGPELADPAVQAMLSRLQPTAIVTCRSVAADVGAVQALATAGVDVATGGWGGARRSVLPEQRDLSSARTINQLTGIRPSAFVPARPVDALDLLWAHRRHLSIVVPRHTIEPEHLPLHLVAGDSYVLDGRGSTPAEVAGALAALARTASGGGNVLTGLQAFE